MVASRDGREDGPPLSLSLSLSRLGRPQSLPVPGDCCPPFSGRSNEGCGGLRSQPLDLHCNKPFRSRSSRPARPHRPRRATRRPSPPFQATALALPSRNQESSLSLSLSPSLRLSSETRLVGETAQAGSNKMTNKELTKVDESLMNKLKDLCPACLPAWRRLAWLDNKLNFVIIT